MSKNYFLKLFFLFCFWWFFLPFPIKADGDAPLPVKGVLKIINVPNDQNLSVQLLNLDSNFFTKKGDLIKFHKWDYTGITQWTGEQDKKILSCEGFFVDNNRDLFVAYRNLGTYTFDRNGSELSLTFYVYNCDELINNSNKYIARIVKNDQFIDSFPFVLNNGCYKGGTKPEETVIDFNDLNREKQLSVVNPNKTTSPDLLLWNDEYKDYVDSQNKIYLDDSNNGPYVALTFIDTEIGIISKKSNVEVLPRKFSDKLRVTLIPTQIPTLTATQDVPLKTITKGLETLKTNTDLNKDSVKIESVDLTKLPIKSILITVFIAILFTLGIELLVAFLMKIKNYKIILLVNLLTQFCLQSIMFVIWYFWYDFYTWQLLVVLEIIIFISEFVLYFKLIRKISSRRLLVYTIVANLLSLASSPLIAWVSLMVN